MEIPDKDMVLLQTVGPTRSTGLNTGVSLDPDKEQQDASEPEIQPESNQRTPVSKNGPSLQALLNFRIQKLLNRRFLLLEMQHFRKKAEDNNGMSTEEMTSEDNDKLCELEAVQKELEELLVKKEELEKQGNGFKLSQQDVCPTFYKTETPHGGIYLLPPPLLTQEDSTQEPTVQTRPAVRRPTGPVVPVDSLGQKAAVTQCPSCQEVVFTETRSRAGDSVWILCCLCSMIGCVAGCCLIPFFVDRLRDIHHQCPRCQAPIHTHQPL